MLQNIPSSEGGSVLQNIPSSVGRSVLQNIPSSEGVVGVAGVGISAAEYSIL